MTRKREVRQCIICREEFEVRPSSSRKYCSRKCFWQALRKPIVKKVCPYCKTEFIVNRRSLGQIFCSQTCGARGGARAGITYETRICIQCKKEFKVEPWRRQRFCSVVCGREGAKKKRARKIEKICPTCGRNFVLPKWKADRQVYCSVKCGAVANAEKKKGVTKKRCRQLKRTRNRPERRTKDGRRVPLHRLVIEKQIGRALLPQERVHHIDFDVTNYQGSNLYLYANESEHQKGHRSIDKLVKPLLEMGMIVFENGGYKLNRRGGGLGRKG